MTHINDTDSWISPWHFSHAYLAEGRETIALVYHQSPVTLHLLPTFARYCSFLWNQFEAFCLKGLMLTGFQLFFFPSKDSSYLFFIPSSPLFYWKICAFMGTITNSAIRRAEEKAGRGETPAWCFPVSQGQYGNPSMVGTQQLSFFDRRATLQDGTVSPQWVQLRVRYSVCHPGEHLSCTPLSCSHHPCHEISREMDLLQPLISNKMLQFF